MNTTVGKSFGLALLLAVGIIAVMVAMGTFSAQRAAAQVLTESDTTLEIESATPAPGAAVEISLSFTAQANVESFGPMEIELEGYGIPSNIDPKNVLIRSGSGTPANGLPVEVTVAGQVITLELHQDPETGTPSITSGQQVVIVFRERAGITAPALAGKYDVKVDDKTLTDGVTVSPTLKVDPKKGGGSTEITVSGKAFADGTGTLSTAYLPADDGKTLKDVTVADGAFSTTIAAKDLVFGGDENMSQIRFVDANGTAADKPFQVTGTMTVGADSVGKGKILKISLVDWISALPDEVKIGGEIVARADDPDTMEVDESTFVDSDGDQVAAPAVADLVADPAGELDIYVKVSGTVGLGTKTVVLFNGGAALAGARDSVEITASALSVSPSSAVAGQEVTVEGSGFNSGKLATLTVGGKSQDRLRNRTLVTEYDVLSGGRVVLSFVVPDEVTKGDKMIVVTDDDGRIGQVTLTVPEPTIAVTPPSSRRGTDVTVEGTGFPAEKNITVAYGAAEPGIATGRTDDTGVFTASFRIPSTATIGGSVDIKASVTVEGTTYSDTESHMVPDKEITVTPEVVRSGDTITITGTGFPRFSDVGVKFADLGWRATTAQTDDVGDFTVSVTVPGMDVGTRVLQVRAPNTIDGESDSWVLTVPEAPSARAVEDVFAALIGNGSLQTIWAYDFATGGWSSYTTDPETSFGNDLFEVESGDILYINVTGEQSFSHQKGNTLPDGWSLITVK